MDRWLDGWIVRRIDEWIYGWMDYGSMFGWMDGWID
jgi:hypothetical protein